MLDFPNNPTVGQTFVSAGATWTWDGVKWRGSAASSGGGGGVPEAPLDGQQYGRQSAAWTVVPTGQGGGGGGLPLTGGALTGPLILAGDPTVPLGAATKQYVDAHSGSGGLADAPTDGQLYGRQSAAWAVVPTGGGTAGTITSPVKINGTGATPYPGTFDPAAADLILNKAGATHFAAITLTNNGSVRWQMGSDTNNETGSPPNSGSGFFISNFSDSGASLSLPIQISRATGVVTFAQPIVNGSDGRSKRNIEPVKDALAIIGQLQGVFYQFKSDPRRQVGLIAQDVIKPLPEVVFESPPQPSDPRDPANPMLGIAYSNIVAVLINAVNELSAKVAALEGASAR
jgi:Chaperone of endosialidase